MNNTIIKLFILSLILLFALNSISLPSMEGKFSDIFLKDIQSYNDNTVAIHFSTFKSEIIWEKTYGGEEDDKLKSISKTDDEGYVLCGCTYSFDDYFGNGWLIKTDSNGNEQWNFTYGGNGFDSLYDVEQTNDGGFIAIGESNSYSDNTDGWVVKVNSQGNKQWNSTYGGKGTEELWTIEQTSDNGFILGGIKINNDFDDIWIVKTDNNGTEQWNRTFFENKFHDWVEEIIITPDDGFLLVGSTSSDGDYLDTDMLIIKVDKYGSELWRSIFNNGQFEYSAGVEIAENGDFLIVGVSQGISNNIRLSTNIELIRIDENGQKIWSKKFGEKYNNEFGTTITRLMDNGYLIIGSVQRGYYDTFNCLVMKIDSDGYTEWIHTYGGDKSDFGTEGFQTIDNDFIIAGSTESYGSGKSDFWLFKIKYFENQRPEQPSKPNGPTSGKFGEKLIYSCSGIDSDDGELYYLFDWGDDTDSGWLGPYESGQICEASHSWEKEKPWNIKGSYEIKVKTRDDHGGESAWSDPLSVSMTRNRAINTPFLRFLERFPNLLPIMRLLFQRLGQ